MERNLIAFWGYPHPDEINKAKIDYPNHEFIDLDVGIDSPLSGILPEAYCKIIHNILDNAVHFKDKIDFVLAAVGEEKCDAGRLAAKLLQDMGFKVIETKFSEYSEQTNISTPISQSNLPLFDKVITIMDGVIEPQTVNPVYCEPTAGFWGVPPHDIDVLKLFPDSTHVYGWIRCVEAHRPADFDLEMFIGQNVPTVFFAQTFCPKMQLAKYLAEKHDGLYVDVDDIASNSVKAKIEAFLRLR